MAKALVDLMRNEQTSESILETLREYVDSGSAISSITMESVLRNTNLNKLELEIIYQCLEEGMKDQLGRGHYEAGLEYFRTMGYIAPMIKKR